MQLEIRPFRPADKATVLTLFSSGILEHIGPCFRNAMMNPLYLSITLALCAAGYLLGSLLAAVLLPGVWVGFVYYCCHELYARFVRERLRSDMQDIPRSFLSKPDDCFWVAEAQVNGKAQILGMVAVASKQHGEEKYGELFRMIISPLCRRAGLGSKMAKTAIDFCQQQGFSKVVLETSSTQSAAVALYKKLGFSLVFTHTQTESPLWIVRFAGVKVLRMEKSLQG